jgi:hypothetical protein
MTTSRERESILNEYGAWVEEKTLGGIDTSVEAYMAEVQAEENLKKVQALEVWAEHDDATFLRKGRRVLGIEGPKTEALDEH